MFQLGWNNQIFFFLKTAYGVLVVIFSKNLKIQALIQQAWDSKTPWTTIKSLCFTLDTEKLEILQLTVQMILVLTRVKPEYLKL